MANKGYYEKNKVRLQKYGREYSRKWRLQHKKAKEEYLRKYREEHLEQHRSINRRWRKKNPEKVRIYNLIIRNPQKYPLGSECVFCGETAKLEHGHLNYEDDGYNYLTVCHACNMWMDYYGQVT